MEAARVEGEADREGYGEREKAPRDGSGECEVGGVSSGERMGEGPAVGKRERRWWGEGSGGGWEKGAAARGEGSGGGIREMC